MTDAEIDAGALAAARWEHGESFESLHEVNQRTGESPAWWRGVSLAVLMGARG